MKQFFKGVVFPEILNLSVFEKNQAGLFLKQTRKLKVTLEKISVAKDSNQ